NVENNLRLRRVFYAFPSVGILGCAATRFTPLVRRNTTAAATSSCCIHGHARRHGPSAGRRLVGYSNVLQLALPFESEVNIADAQWQPCGRYTKCVRHAETTTLVRNIDMKTKRIGNSDLFITPMGFGAWAIGGPNAEVWWGALYEK